MRNNIETKKRKKEQRGERIGPPQYYYTIRGKEKSFLSWEKGISLFSYSGRGKERRKGKWK